MWSNLNQLLFHLIDFNRRSFRQNIRHFMMMKVPYLMTGEAKAVHQKLLELSFKIFSIWDLLHTVQFNLFYWDSILIVLNKRLKEESFQIQRLHSLCPIYPDSIVTLPLQEFGWTKLEFMLLHIRSYNFIMIHIGSYWFILIDIFIYDEESVSRQIAATMFQQ